MPHLHVLVSRFLPQSVVSRLWDRTGMGDVVHIEKVNARKAGHYIAKYLAKDAMAFLPAGINRYGASEDLDLSVRSSGGEGQSEWLLAAQDAETGVWSEAQPGDFLRRPD